MIFYIFALYMSSVEQTSTKETSLKFSSTSSVSTTDNSNLVENPLATITEHAQVENTAAPIIYIVPVFHIAVNQQEAVITQIAPGLLSAALTLQETLDKIMSRMTQI